MYSFSFNDFFRQYCYRPHYTNTETEVQRIRVPTQGPVVWVRGESRFKWRHLGSEFVLPSITCICLYTLRPLRSRRVYKIRLHYDDSLKVYSMVWDICRVFCCCFCLFVLNTQTMLRPGAVWHTQRQISLHHLVSSDSKCLLFGSSLRYHILAICPELPFELPRWVSGKESARQCSRHREYRFDTWVGKIPWRKWQFTPVFLPGEFHGQRSLAGYRL